MHSRRAACWWAAEPARGARPPSSRSSTSGLGSTPPTCAPHRRRHRSRRLRHGHHGLALDRDRGHRAVDGRRQGDRQGAKFSGAAEPRRGGHRLRQREVLGVGTDRTLYLEGGGPRRLQPAQLPPRPRAQVLRHLRAQGHVGPTAATSARRLGPGDERDHGCRIADDVGTVIELTLKGHATARGRPGRRHALMEQVVFKSRAPASS